MGLLQQASLINQNLKLAFNAIIIKYNIKTAAILCNTNGDFYIQDSVGFDFQSIKKSFSTKDFWQGIIQNTNQIYTFDAKNKISSFFQFFSDKMQDNLNELNIVKISQDRIFILMNMEIDQKLLQDLQYLTEKSKINNKLAEWNTTLTINFNDAIKSQTKDFPQLLKSLENSIYNYVLIKFNSEYFGIESLEENIYKIFYNGQSPLSTTVLKKHLTYEFLDLLESQVNKILITKN